MLSFFSFHLFSSPFFFSNSKIPNSNEIHGPWRLLTVIFMLIKNWVTPKISCIFYDKIIDGGQNIILSSFFFHFAQTANYFVLQYFLSGGFAFGAGRNATLPMIRSNFGFAVIASNYGLCHLYFSSCAIARASCRSYSVSVITWC